MADETAASYVDLLREFRGPLTFNIRWSTIFMSEIKRDKNPRRWNGKQVTVPLILAPQAGFGMGTESSTMPLPVVLETDQATITSAIAEHSVSFSTKLLEAAKNTGDTSWADPMPLKMREAEKAFSRNLNEQFLGSSDALIAACTGSNSNSTTVTVGTSANFYQLYYGRRVDILTRSNGAAVSNGLQRKITAVNTASGTITLDAAVTTTSSEGVYIENSYGNALQGLTTAAATSGSFEGIDKGTFAYWQGIDASPSAASDLSMSILDSAERKYLTTNGSYDGPDFYLGDPAVIDKYQQGLVPQARWEGSTGKLSTGFTGIVYRDKLLLWEPDAPNSTLFGVTKEDITLYTLDDGPDWDDRTGSVFQRFTRALPIEAWLVWMLQVGYHKCNGQVKIGSLNRAA